MPGKMSIVDRAVICRRRRRHLVRLAINKPCHPVTLSPPTI